MDSTETGHRRYNSLIEGLYKIRQDICLNAVSHNLGLAIFFFFYIQFKINSLSKFLPSLLAKHVPRQLLKMVPVCLRAHSG